MSSKYKTMSTETIKKIYGVSEAEAERIRNYYVTLEEYPDDCTIIEKVITKDKNGETIVRLKRAYGRKRDREYRSSRRPHY